MDFVEGDQIGAYRVLRRLGAGGMGAVYLAVHDRIERKVAIKVLRPDLSQRSDLATRFLNEARVVNIVQHPGLVQISDIGQLPDGTAFIVMEYLEGESLHAYMMRKGRISRAKALALAREIAHPLRAAHDKGIVHRDLKPDNVMIVKDASVPGGRRVKLLDFGIAKVAEELQKASEGIVHTRAGILMGTPLYMAPEQCKSASEASDRSDIYALGAILYHMLAGQPPFSAQGPGEVMAMHLYQMPRPLTEVDPALPAQVSALVLRMLAKEAAERPSADDVIRSLDDLLNPVLPVARRDAGSKERRAAAVEPVPPAPARAAAPGPATLWGRMWARRLLLGAAFSVAGLMAGLILMKAPPTRNAAEPREPGCSADGLCRVSLPMQVSRLRGLWGTGTAHLYAVGDHGTIVRFDGSWSLYDRLLKGQLRGIHGTSQHHIWLVGERGSIFYREGGGFAPAPTVTQHDLIAVWGASVDDAWAVGRQGTILHFDGSSWSEVESPTQKGLYAVWGTARNDAWAVGKEGTILHFDGSSWSLVPAITDAQLQGLWGAARSDVWAVGKEGTILHFDGSSWSRAGSGTVRSLNGVAGSGPGDIWVAGDQGLVLHNEGQGFRPVRSGVTEDLDAVWTTRDAVWLAGNGGVILHLARPR